MGAFPPSLILRMPFLHGIKDATTYGVDVKSWDFDFKSKRKDQVVSSLKTN